MVSEWNLTTDTEELCLKGKMPERLFIKSGNSGSEYVMAGETVTGVKCQGLLFLLDGNLSDIGLEDILRFAGLISTAVIKKIRRIEGWIYRMKNVSW